MDKQERERLVKEATEYMQSKVPFSVEVPERDLRQFESQFNRWLTGCRFDDSIWRKGVPAPITTFVSSRLDDIRRELEARDQADASHLARESLAVDRDALREAKESNRKATIANVLAIVSLVVAFISLIASFLALKN